MTAQELHLEQLLGKQILDSRGKPVGRLEEVIAIQQADGWVIQEYLVGPLALLERLSAWSLGLTLLRLLGAQKLAVSYRIPWHQLDLTHPDTPRLNCTLEELKTFQSQPQS